MASALPVSGHIVFDTGGGGGSLMLADGHLTERIEEVFFDVEFEGDVAPATLGACPNIFAPQFQCALATGPFRMTGEMAVFGTSGALLLKRDVTGTGVARVGFVEPGRGGGPFAEYRFEAAAATPEPGTFLLMLCGAVGLRRKLRGRQTV